MSNTFQKRMRTARGTMSYEEATYAIREYLTPAQWVSISTTRRIEHITEEEADPVLVWALSQVYRVPLEKLSTIASEWIQRFSDQVKHVSSCMTIQPGRSLASV